jgi:hypothetical protein
MIEETRGVLVLGHVRSLAKADHVFGLRGLGQRRGRIGVRRDHVDALVDQRLGGIGFLRRVEPGEGPDDLSSTSGFTFLAFR